MCDKLKQSGGPLIFTMPAPARKAMHLNAGDEVDVMVDDDRMVLEPVAPAPAANAGPPPEVYA